MFFDFEHSGYISSLKCSDVPSQEFLLHHVKQLTLRRSWAVKAFKMASCPKKTRRTSRICREPSLPEPAVLSSSRTTWTRHLGSVQRRRWQSQGHVTRAGAETNKRSNTRDTPGMVVTTRWDWRVLPSARARLSRRLPRGVGTTTTKVRFGLIWNKFEATQRPARFGLFYFYTVVGQEMHTLNDGRRSWTMDM